MCIKLTRVGLALILICLATGAGAQGTAKPKATLNAEVAAQFPDNSVGGITPQILRNVTNDMIASSQQYAGVNAQVGTTYTVQASDYGQLVTFNNAGAIAVALPSAASAGFSPFSFYASAVGAGAVTITPAIGTINGAASFVVTSGTSALIVSDGTNYQVFKGFGSGAVNASTTGAVAFYAANGSTVSGSQGLTVVGSSLFVGQNASSQGALTLFGGTSGSLTISPQAVAGTPTWTAGTSSGTPVVTASLPMTINPTTGNIICTTCATSTLNTAALTKTDDTNVTLTLGGTPGSALLNATSLTLGWTGQLAVGRGGTGQLSLTSNAFLTGNGASAINQVAITGLVLGNGASAPTAYGGTSCTNQFPRSLNASGAATCATVANTDLASSSVTYGSTAVSLGGTSTSIAGLTSLGLTSAATANWNSDVFLGRLGAANLQFGAANSGTPTAQTLSVQNASGSNIAAAASLTIVGPLSTGTGTDGDIIFQTGVKQISGSTGATATTALTLKGETQLATFTGPTLVTGTVAPSLANGNALVYASATNGGLHGGKGSTNDVSLVNSAGTVAANIPTGTTNFNVVGTLTFGTLSSTSLAASTTTISGLTVNNSPIAGSDFFLYLDSANGRISKCTVAACNSAGVAGVATVNGLAGALTLAQGNGIGVTSGGTTITVATNFALKADQQAATSAILTVNPSQQQSHPSAAKAWCMWVGATAGTNACTVSYNVTSVTRNSTGNYNVNFTTAFSTANYVCAVSASTAGAGFALGFSDSSVNATSAVRIAYQNSVGAAADPTNGWVVCYGTQ